MNTVSRTITGLVTIFFGLWFFLFLGLVDCPGVDFVALVIGIFFLVIGFVILFNKKEDQIEQIRYSRKGGKK